MIFINCVDGYAIQSCESCSVKTTRAFNLFCIKPQGITYNCRNCNVYKNDRSQKHQFCNFITTRQTISGKTLPLMDEYDF